MLVLLGEVEVAEEVEAASSSLEADVAIESSRLSFGLKAPILTMNFAAVGGRDDNERLLAAAAAAEARGRRNCEGEEDEATVLIADADADDDGIEERISISVGKLVK